MNYIICVSIRNKKFKMYNYFLMEEERNLLVFNFPNFRVKEKKDIL